MTQKYLNELTHTIIGAAIDVHKELGPVLLESIYEKCMAHLLREKGFNVVSQQKVPLVFRGLHLDCELRFDLLIADVYRILHRLYLSLRKGYLSVVLQIYHDQQRKVDWHWKLSQSLSG